jgi:hypothetical protein
VPELEIVPCFRGTDKSRIADRLEIHSIPLRAVEEAIGFVQKHDWQWSTGSEAQVLSG